MNEDINNNHRQTPEQDNRSAPSCPDSGHEAPDEVENAGEPEEEFLGEAAEVEPQEVAGIHDADSDRLLRLMADFDNFRRRSAREIVKERQRGRRDAAEKLLPVFDALTSGLLSLKQDDPVRAGMEAVYRQLLTAFQQIGIEKIETKGQPFDPELMEAIAKFPSPEVPEGHVMDESRAGFRDDIGLLRPPQVVISAGPPN